MEAQYIVISKSGSKFYYKDREMTIRHRTDGPAVEYPNGDKAWYINDECLSEEEHKRQTSPEILLTMDEIASKFGVDVSKLKIVK